MKKNLTKAKIKTKKIKKKKSNAGRKRIEIPERGVLKLAEVGCTNVEIASFYEVSESTIRRNFGEILIKGRECGKIRLRKKQFNIALQGNVKMLIWLGKQILGQAEPEQQHKLSGNLTLADIAAQMAKNGS